MGNLWRWLCNWYRTPRAYVVVELSDDFDAAAVLLVKRRSGEVDVETVVYGAPACVAFENARSVFTDARYGRAVVNMQSATWECDLCGLRVECAGLPAGWYELREPGEHGCRECKEARAPEGDVT